jgi:hypothetical protein
MMSVASTLALAASSARADNPAPGMTFLAGASVLLAGFAVGGQILATSGGSTMKDNAGWLTIEGGFALAPFVSHALAGEWTRALAFAAPPAVMTGGTVALFQANPQTIEHGEIGEQRVMWSLFGAGLIAGAVGVVDSTFAETRARSVALAPLIGSGRVGLTFGGTL